MIHFISGLPRSGSTLLAAILAQNPQIYATSTSPLAFIYQAMLRAIGAESDYADIFTGTRRVNLLRGLFQNYYATDRTTVIFDTNRYWCSAMSAIVTLFPDARVVACVRDPVWILDSFERLYQQNPLSLSKLYAPYTPDQMATVFTRCDNIAASPGVLGFAFNATQEAFYGQHADKLIIVDYETLCAEPGRVVETIYAELSLEGFRHDFNAIAPIDDGGFDKRFGTPGMHQVNHKVELTPRNSILPPDIINRFANNNLFWRDAKTRSRALVIRKSVTAAGLVAAF